LMEHVDFNSGEK